LRSPPSEKVPLSVALIFISCKECVVVAIKT
jgi:hypothetical protein